MDDLVSKRARYRESARGRHRAVVRLATRDGMSGREIAVRLGITEGRVRDHLARQDRIRSRRRPPV